MAVTVAREQNVIVCPSCGGRRVVDPRTRRRSRAAGGIPCVSCRGHSPTRTFSDADLRWWIRRFGGEVPKGTPVRQFLAAGGAPPELRELARQCHPDAIVR